MAQRPSWFKFQEEIKSHFRSIGAVAETNVRLQGVRTTHDIDIHVKTQFLGENVTWIIEAKHWKKKVSKNHVLALRTIVEDLGADRGFIISSAGFQRGAVEAAEMTNVRVKTFSQLKADTKDFVEAEILKVFDGRLRILDDRYWSHSKSARIKYGLRHDTIDSEMMFTGQQILTTARRAVLAARNHDYPINVESYMEEHQGERQVDNFQQLSMWLNINLNYFERKLLNAEWEMHKNGDYNPDMKRYSDDEGTTTQMIAEATYAITKYPQWRFDKAKKGEF